MDCFRNTLILILLLASVSWAQEVAVSRKTVDGTKTDVTKWAAYQKAGSTYDVISKKLDFDVNTHTGKGWLLIHDKVNVKNIICVDGETGTIWDMVVCSSKQDCFDKATALGLKYVKEDYDHEEDCTAAGVLLPADAKTR